MKFLTLFLVMFISVQLSAAMTVEEVKKTLSGQYKIETDEGVIRLVLRSSGKVMVLNDNDEFEYAEGNMSFNYSNNDWAINGLPVASIVIGHGSDEDTRDYHFLLTVEEAWEVNSDHEIKLITTFTTFNDGPNSYSMLEKSKFNVFKYDKKTKKYQKL